MTKVTLQVTLPELAAEQLLDAARKAGLKQSALLSRIVKEWVEQNNPEEIGTYIELPYKSFVELQLTAHELGVQRPEIIRAIVLEWLEERRKEWNQKTAALLNKAQAEAALSPSNDGVEMAGEAE